MAIGETAVLAVELKLNGVTAYSSGMSQVHAANAKAASGVSGFRGALGVAGKELNAFSGHLGHAKGAIGGLLTGPLGIIGLTGGLFSLGGVIEGSLRHTSDFALGIEKLTGLTGESGQAMGSMILMFEKYGLSAERTGQVIGFLEKTLGKLHDTAVAAAPSTALLALEHRKLQLEAAGATTAVAKQTDTVLKGLEAQLKAVRARRSEDLYLTKASRLAYKDEIDAIERQIKAHHGLRTAHQTSALAAINQAIAEQKAKDALHNTGVEINKLEEIDRRFGLHLEDTKGNVVSGTEALRQIADYYSSSASASDKAYVAATLLGRGYADLIPVLKKGSAGIDEAAKQAAALGLNLGPDNLKQISDYRESIRGLGEAMGILQLNIGLALIPAVKDLADNITHWLATGGAQKVTRFFKDGAAFAQDLGKQIQTYVLPAFRQIGDWWKALPDPLKGLLIGGVVANKAGKFLFDFGLKDLAKGLGGLGGLLTRGTSAANPVWVQSVTGGMPGGGPGGLGPASLLGTLLATIGLQQIANSTIPNGPNAYNVPVTPSGVGPNLIDPSAAHANAAAHGGTLIDMILAALGGGRGNQLVGGSSWDTHSEDRRIQMASIAATKANTEALRTNARNIERDWLRHVGGLAGVMARSRAATGHDPTKAQAEAIYTRDELHQLKIITEKSKASSDTKLERLKVLAQDAKDHGDIKTATKIQAAIDRMKADLKAAASATTTSVEAAASTIVGAITGSDRNAYLTVNVDVSVGDVSKKIVKRSRYYEGSKP